MARSGVMDIKELEEIVRILKENGVTEFELERENTHIKLSRAVLAPQGAQAHASQITHTPIAALPNHGTAEASPGGAPSTQPAAPQAAVDEFAGLTKVESPIVGTFYRKPSPDAEPFVKVGDTVSKGDTLCIVEAMKLMNEIEAPCSGKVIKVLPQDAQVVEFGELLVVIEP